MVIIARCMTHNFFTDCYYCYYYAVNKEARVRTKKRKLNVSDGVVTIGRLYTG